MAAEIGINQWFHFQDYHAVERVVKELRSLGVRALRTGISWADWHRREGPAWYDWQMAALSEFDILLSIWHTPPSIAEGGTCAGPPLHLDWYAAFIEEILVRYGDSLDTLELWNEPNNRLKWDFERYDPQWEKFGRMVRLAAERARAMKARTVLGGIVPVDPAWLHLMQSYGVLAAVDVVAIHGFPGMWWSDAPNWDWHRDWHGWEEKVNKAQRATGGKEVWITETGFATWNMSGECPGLWEQQSAMLEQAVRAPVERVYWYSLFDLDPARAAIEGFHVDENEYHLGLLTFDGQRKPAYDMFKSIAGEPLGASFA
ncbi:MAG: hypothetical protein KDD69_14890 [Bdellovibrionales bacterium]|nr:hypothetical protein [Bdellovibrionales bacterium]